MTTTLTWVFSLPMVTIEAIRVMSTCDDIGWMDVDDGWMDCNSPVWWIQKEEEQDLCLRSLLIYTQYCSRIGVRKKKFFFFPSLVSTAQHYEQHNFARQVFYYAIESRVMYLWVDPISEHPYGITKTDATWIGQLMGCVQKFVRPWIPVPIIVNLMGSLFLTITMSLLHLIPSYPSPMAHDDV